MFYIQAYPSDPVNGYKNSVNQERIISLGLVLLQFAFCIAIVAFVPWSALLQGQFPVYGLTATSWLAVPCILFGGLLGLGAWSAIGLKRLRIMPEPGSGTQLVSSGPYRYIRHPMYTGVLLLMAGLAILELSWPSGIAWCLLYLVLARKAIREEKFLQQRFPEYRQRMRHTGRFVPRVWSITDR